jgi:hypothetical protein
MEMRTGYHSLASGSGSTWNVGATAERERSGLLPTCLLLWRLEVRFGHRVDGTVSTLFLVVALHGHCDKVEGRHKLANVEYTPSVSVVFDPCARPCES